MSKPAIADAQQSLCDHAADKGAEIHAKYGPRIGWQELQLILADRACARYPCDVVFDPAPLRQDELACAILKGAAPEAGFTIFLHPCFATRLDLAPWLVLYQLVLVNYGAWAAADAAESFGAAALNITKDEYYDGLCNMDRFIHGDNKKIATPLDINPLHLQNQGA